MGVACRKTLLRELPGSSDPSAARLPRPTSAKPRRSIQKTVFRSSTSMTKLRCTCSSLRAADQVENFIGFLRKCLEFGGQPGERLIQGEEFVSVFFEKFAARFEGEAAFACAGNNEKNNCERSRSEPIAPDMCGVIDVFALKEISVSRASSSMRRLLTEMPK